MFPYPQSRQRPRSTFWRRSGPGVQDDFERLAAAANLDESLWRSQHESRSLPKLLKTERSKLLLLGLSPPNPLIQMRMLLAWAALALAGSSVVRREAGRRKSRG